MRHLLLTACLLLIFLSSFSQGREYAFDVNQRLGRGINIGNTFEAPTETSWNNPWNADYCKMIADLGFTHIRVPVRWEPSDRSSATAPYTIKAAFLERIKSVVDEALKNNLHVIINMHHHEVLGKNPTAQMPRFKSQWQQIADYFKDYPDGLLFEILNEPGDGINADIWKQLTSVALGEIRTTNPDRIVLLAPIWGVISGLSRLEIPDDPYTILTVHYYNPFSFTHQGTSWTSQANVKDVKWLDTEADRATIRQELEYIKHFSKIHNIPVHIGEFGSYSTADIDSRERWTTCVTRLYEEFGFSWAYWEFSSEFGIYNPKTKKYLQPLVNALLHNSLPDSVSMNLETIGETSYSANSQNWQFYASSSSTAKGSMRYASSKVEATVTSKGKETNDAQLIRSKVPMEKNRYYRLSFTASADKACAAFFTMGRNSQPWDVYTSKFYLTADTKEQEYSYLFKMKDFDDAAARLCFDLGHIEVPVTLKIGNVKIKKMEQSTVATENVIYPKSFSCNFNSEQSKLVFTNERNDCLGITVYSVNGAVLLKKTLQPGVSEISAPAWSQGIYIATTENNETIKIMKQ